MSGNLAAERASGPRWLGHVETKCDSDLRNPAFWRFVKNRNWRINDLFTIMVKRCHSGCMTVVSTASPAFAASVSLDHKKWQRCWMCNGAPVALSANRRAIFRQLTRGQNLNSE